MKIFDNLKTAGGKIIDTFRRERGRTSRRLDEDTEQGLGILFDITKDRFAILSDVHKGNCVDEGDDFKHNKNLYRHALDYYLKEEFNLVLSGDIEEGWEFDYKNIIEAYKSFSQFGQIFSSL